MQKLCSNEQNMNKELGTKMAQKLMQRMMELKAADTLADISHLPPSRLHELVNTDGVFSVDLEHPNRLLFRPAMDSVVLKEDGGVDKARVLEIMILEISDTHDPKSQRKRR
jgi:proteic killer suppression protein